MSIDFTDKISEIISEPISALGFEIVQILFNNINKKVLEILIERLDGKQVSISDCTLVSRNIGVLLDVEEIMPDKYSLEVSSPGIERPLVKFKDYIRFINNEVKIKLKHSLNNRSTYQGKIIDALAKDNKIIILFEKNEITIDFENIKNGRLVLTKEMFKNLLNKKIETE